MEGDWMWRFFNGKWGMGKREAVICIDCRFLDLIGIREFGVVIFLNFLSAWDLFLIGFGDYGWLTLFFILLQLFLF